MSIYKEELMLSKLFDSVSDGETEGSGKDILIYEKIYKKLDALGFELTMYVQTYDEECFIFLNHKTSERSILALTVVYTYTFLCEQEDLKILSRNSQERIFISFYPNLSFKIRELSISVEEYITTLGSKCIFNKNDLSMLFKTNPIEEPTCIGWNSINSFGFTLKIWLYPEINKCNVILLYNQLEKPLFDATFTNIQNIECDLSTDQRKMILHGIGTKEGVEISFDPSFQIDLPRFI